MSAERVTAQLRALVDEVATVVVRVDEHLKTMGAVWK